MRKFVCFFILITSCGMHVQNKAIAQQSSMVLSFEGKNAQTGAVVQLESVYIKNFTSISEITLYGAAPYLYLTWPSSIDEMMGSKQSGFSISTNFPNPFSSSTSFELAVTERSNITIKLLDVYGAIVAYFQQELDWGLHTFEVFTAKNSIYFITADNGITSRTIKLVSIGNNHNQNQTIRYSSIENLKTGSDISTFYFNPGDQLGMKATAIEFKDKTIFHNPTETTSYVFELEPVSGAALVADYTANPTSGIAPLTVNFTDQSANNPSSWQWNFGDGNTSTLQNPQYTYHNSGTYTVQLTVSNSFGSDTKTKTDYIQVSQAGSPPIASFIANPTYGAAPFVVNFTDQSANNPTNWLWNFGDGNTSILQNPQHTYQNAGSYTVQLTVTNNYGSNTELKSNYISVGVTGQPCPGSPTVTDFDGNVYVTVLVGNQCWMKENLKSNHDASGNYITRFCYDNNTTNCELYGGLYIWYTLMNGDGSSNGNPSGVQGICPTGWHVPSDSEWKQLVDYVVSQGFPNQSENPNGAGNALKSCRQTYSPLGGDCNTTEHPRWDYDNIHYGFDEFGFSALPGGFRYTNGSFEELGYSGIWWSSTENSSPNALYRYFRSDFGGVGIWNFVKTTGFSVRCLRD
jgi:uncharacterized protein (TIGR02145 family)